MLYFPKLMSKSWTCVEFLIAGGEVDSIKLGYMTNESNVSVQYNFFALIWGGQFVGPIRLIISHIYRF